MCQPTCELVQPSESAPPSCLVLTRVISLAKWGEVRGEAQLQFYLNPSLLSCHRPVSESPPPPHTTTTATHTHTPGEVSQSQLHQTEAQRLEIITRRGPRAA